MVERRRVDLYNAALQGFNAAASAADAAIKAIIKNEGGVGPLTNTELKDTYVLRSNSPILAKSHGVVANGITDDGPALAAAIAAAGSGGKVILPPGNLRVTSPVLINLPITIEGTGYFTSRIYADNCGGIFIANGVSNVVLNNFEVALAVRHSITANTLIGIRVEGDNVNRPSNHVYRDIYIDGFSTGIQSDYLWSSNFYNVRTNFGLIGLHAYGKSVNNFIHGCSFSVAALTGSKGIAIFGRESPIDNTEVATEGWVISDTLTNGAQIGIDLLSANHIVIHDCILDFNFQYAIRVQNGPSVFATNYSIHDNYIAMTGATAASAILLSNTINDAQKRYTRIHHNEIIVYSGSVCTYGIAATGSLAQSIIEGNTLRNFGTHDIYVTHSDTLIKGNVCLSSITDNIRCTASCEVEGNIGTVFRTGSTASSNYTRNSLGRRMVSGPAAPTTGSWLVGERVINDVPAVGSPKSWVCTVAGTPGTWVSEGNL